MSLISKDAEQAAFDNADPDVLADYGPEMAKRMRSVGMCSLPKSRAMQSCLRM